MPVTGLQKPWYQWPRVDNMGSPDPYGGFPKPDSNIQLPANYPVTALLSGTVTYIDTGNVAWGGVITILLDKPLNSLATHTAYLHLASEVVSKGQHVGAGQLIGYNGGTSAQGSQKVPLGFALYNGDHYGVDSAWSLETASNLNGGPLDPVPLLNSAANGTTYVPQQYTSGGNPLTTSVVTAFNTVAQNTQDTLANIPGLIGIIETIDLVEQFQPLHLTSNASPTNPTPTDYTIFGIDTGVPNYPAAYSKLVKDIQLPADNIQAILVFVTTNTKAFAIRSGLILIGLTIIFVLIMNFLMSEVL